MTDVEIALCLQTGFLPDPVMGLRRMRQITSAMALRLHYDTAKCFGDQLAMKGDEAGEAQMKTRDRCLAVIRALRLFKDGSVSVPGLLHFSNDWWVAGSIHFQFDNPGLMPAFNKYELSAADGERFATFWPVFEGAGLVGPLGIATRRFSDASERERAEDAVVDLMIAAESLFLSHAGDAQDRGELRYRLALRAAFFVDSSEYSKREVFRHMKRAYDVRSAIAHGAGEPARNLLKSPKEPQIFLSEFRDTTAKLLRVALQKAVGMATPDGRIGVNWDDLIIPP